MVGEPLFRMGEDFMGVKLPVEMVGPRITGSGFGGRGCASKEIKTKILKSFNKTKL